MAILMTAELAGATKEMIDGLTPLLQPLRQQPGFVIHTNGPVDGGWRVVEVWNSQAEFEAWYEANVLPNFPAGAPKPVVSFDELNDVVMP